MSSDTRIAVIELVLRGASESEILDALFRIYGSREEMERFIERAEDRMEFLAAYGGPEWRKHEAI